jgi:hypothetical protein
MDTEKITIIDCCYLWTYKDPKTNQWVEDNKRYMCITEAAEYFTGIDKKIEFKTLPYQPKIVRYPYINGQIQWLNGVEVDE